TNENLYLCSAAVLNLPNKRTVQTAGHCMFDPVRQVQYANHYFVPGYNTNGTGPYRGWESAVYISHYKWNVEGKYHYDYAFMRMRPQDGYNVQDFTGGLGFAINQDNDFVDFIGYPANSPYDG